MMRTIKTAVTISGIQASVIAAVASRESRGGSLLVSTGGYGDNGHAWGIMQVSRSKRNACL